MLYDHLVTTYPESSVGGPGWLTPTVIHYDAGATDGIKWDDVTPRIGAAYDLFGNGKTALKFNLGKYMEAFTANNSDLDLNPLIRTVISTTRVWTDSNKDFIASDLVNPNKNGECDAMADKNSARRSSREATILTSFTATSGRQLGPRLSLQQEIVPRVSVNVGYFRNWWNNRARRRQPVDCAG